MAAVHAFDYKRVEALRIDRGVVDVGHGVAFHVSIQADHWDGAKLGRGLLRAVLGRDDAALPPDQGRGGADGE